MSLLRKNFGRSTAESPPSQEESSGAAPRLVRRSIGPSPWAWCDRSQIIGDVCYRFSDLGENNNLSGITKVVNGNDEVVLLLDFKVYARFFDDGRGLMWWEEGEKKHKQIAITSFRLSSLLPIDDPVKAAKRIRDEKNKVFGLHGIEIVRIPCFLDSGLHAIAAPAEWKDFEETLVLADHTLGSNGFDVMHRALFVFDWIAQQVTVLPQDWFNNGAHDFGYQWIAQMARDESGAFIGEGIRLGTFELDESGREVKQWLNQNPFHKVR